MVAAGSAGGFGGDGWSRFLQKHPGNHPVKAAPKRPVNRFGFVPALPGALPSTTLSQGLSPGLGAWGEGTILSVSPQHHWPSRIHHRRCNNLLTRGSINCSTAAVDTNNSRIGGKDEAHLALAQVTL